MRLLPPKSPEGFPGADVTGVKVYERGAWRDAEREADGDCDGFYFIICGESDRNGQTRTLLLPGG